MISLKKLYTLKTGTRLRKIVRLLEEWEKDLLAGKIPDKSYYISLLQKMEDDPDLEKDVKEKAEKVLSNIPESLKPEGRRYFNAVRHALLVQLDISPADWDFIHPGDRVADEEEVKSFPGIAVYLDEIRSPFNVGSIFRTAESLGVSEVLLSPGTADPRHPRSLRTSMGCVDRMKWSREDYKALSERDTKFFALELGGKPLESFTFPAKGILVIGSEEVGVSPECLSLVDHSLGRATIPLYGWKGSLNVSVAFGIILNQWVQSFSV